MGWNEDHQQNKAEDRQNSGRKDTADDSGKKTTLSSLCRCHDLKSGIEHRLRKVPVDLSLGCYGDCGDREVHLLGKSGLEQVLDGGFHHELRLGIELAADLLPKLDAKTGERPVLFENKGLDYPRGYAKPMIRWLGECESRNGVDKQDRHETHHEDYPIEQNCGLTC